MINCNPADRVQRPKKIKFEPEPYTPEELDVLFDAVKGTNLELGVILAAFYGLRRGEVVGLKWKAIDFDRKTITIKHTVTQTQIDGKYVVLEKDRPKTKLSNRSLPLVKSFEDLLMILKEKQEINKKLCGNSYCNKYSEYIYLNEIGVG